MGKTRLGRNIGSASAFLGRSRHLALRAIGTAIAAATVVLSTPAYADCASYIARVESALAADNRDTLRSAYDDDTDCHDAVYHGQVGHMIAQRLLTRLGETPNELELKEILSYGPEWQAFSMLGDLYRDEKRYAEATEKYQKAITAINALPQDGPGPSKEIVMDVMQRAQESWSLASHYVSTARNRAGMPDGLAAAQVRGVTIVKISAPVQFVFGTAKFTEDGLKAVVDMAEVLRLQKPAHIALVGHTDQVGTDAANLILSVQRANAVAGYLKTHGVSTKIDATGVGESDPFKAPDRESQSQDLRDQEDRRVEMIRN